MADMQNSGSNNPRRNQPQNAGSRCERPRPSSAQQRSGRAGAPKPASSQQQAGRAPVSRLASVQQNVGRASAQRPASPQVQRASAGAVRPVTPRSSSPRAGAQEGRTVRAGAQAPRFNQAVQGARPAQTVQRAQSARAVQGSRSNQAASNYSGQLSGSAVNRGAVHGTARNVGASTGRASGFGAGRGPSGDPQPAQEPKKGGGVWRVVFWIALLVFVVSAGALAYIGYTYWKGQAAYDDIANEAFVMPENATLADFDVDWEALRAINPDVVGWIYMPGTDINYPIAHRAGDDEYYLYHNFNGASSAQFGAEYGSIMLSGVNTADFSDDVNIVYGHNMNNGTMFAPLSNMKEDWFNTYRNVYLLTPQGNWLLKSFAYVHVPGSSTNIVIPNFDSSSDKADYMQARYDGSLFAADPAGSQASDIEQAFALVTCDGANRSYRYITYFEPVDYYALDGGVSGPLADGTTENVVSRDDLSSVGGASDDRTE